MASVNSVEFSSASLSFATAKVQIEVLENNPQIAPSVSWNLNGDLFYRTDRYKQYAELSYKSCRTSVYGHGFSSDSKRFLASPEHLSPVFLMWPHRRFNVNVIGGESDSTFEIPMMDGSALPFFNALRKITGTPEDLLFYEAPVNAKWALVDASTQRAYGCVRIFPSETFEVDYILDREEFGGFKSSARVSVYGPGDLYQIFSSRTFIFDSEYKQACSYGLLSGVNEKNGILLPDSQTKNLQHLYRVAEEPAHHKVLDLVGDLTFAVPALPKVRIEIYNGGHEAHRQIMEKLIPFMFKSLVF